MTPMRRFINTMEVKITVKPVRKYEQ